jgi:hypothetical protein
MNKTLFLSLCVIEVKEKPAQLYKSILTQKRIDNNVLLAIAFFLLVKKTRMMKTLTLFAYHATEYKKCGTQQNIFDQEREKCVFY